MQDDLQIQESRSVVRMRLLVSNHLLVEARKNLGFTQRSFAERIGMKHSRYIDIENLRVLPGESEMRDISIEVNANVENVFPESLLEAVKTKVFEVREKNISEECLKFLTLTEAARSGLLPTGNAEDEACEEVDGERLHQALMRAMSTLKEQEQRVITMRFGLDGDNPKTFESVGKELNVSRSRIAQIETRALRRLRNLKRSWALKVYLH